MSNRQQEFPFVKDELVYEDDSDLKKFFRIGRQIGKSSISYIPYIPVSEVVASQQMTHTDEDGNIVQPEWVTTVYNSPQPAVLYGFTLRMTDQFLASLAPGLLNRQTLLTYVLGLESFPDVSVSEFTDPICCCIAFRLTTHDPSYGWPALAEGQALPIINVNTYTELPITPFE